jgi:hypothetical protein
VLESKQEDQWSLDAMGEDYKWRKGMERRWDRLCVISNVYQLHNKRVARRFVIRSLVDFRVC